MSFVRIRTIKGRSYRYLEERWREGGKIRSRSTYLGPAEMGVGPLSRGIDWGATFATEHGVKYEDEQAMWEKPTEKPIEVEVLTPAVEAPAAPADAAPEAPADAAPAEASDASEGQAEGESSSGIS
jgi:hypothetical protein